MTVPPLGLSLNRYSPQFTWRHRRVLAEQCGDFAPTVDPAQLDLAARHETEE
jgi:hypothetical protein